MKRINPTALQYGVLLGVLILFVLILTCGKNRKEYAPVADLKAQLDSSAKRVKMLENKNGLLVADNVALKTSNARDLEALSDSYFKLQDKYEKAVKNVRYVTKLEQVIKTVPVHIPYKDTSNPTGTITVPRSFEYADSNMSLSGTVQLHGVDIGPIQYRIATYLRHGTRKTGFLGLGREDFVQAIAPDTTVHITGLSAITYKVRPNAWNRWIKPVGCFVLGAAGTYYLSANLK